MVAGRLAHNANGDKTPGAGRGPSGPAVGASPMSKEPLVWSDEKKAVKTAVLTGLGTFVDAVDSRAV